MTATFTDSVADLLDAPAASLVTLDFETFYDADFTLRKLTTEAYVRDSRFETIGVGVKVDEHPTVWLEDADFRRWACLVDWAQVALLAHHAHFDGLILSHHYGISPGFWLDTLSMSRALHGTEVGGSLEKLMLAYGVGQKGHEVENAKGKRRRDFTPEEWLRYGDYCRNDVDGTIGVLRGMLAPRPDGSPGFPEVELWNIDTTVRMFTEPSFVLDEPLLQDFLTYEQQRKADLLARVAKERSTLLSNDKFAELLKSLGVEPPRKISPRTRKETWAFAKSDPGMQALLEHEDDDIRWIVEARVGVKSTINETRTERLMRAGTRGPVPVYLKYAGAHTFRWSGGDKMNFQNFERVPPKLDPKKPKAGALRKSLRAPPGEELAVVDSNAIEARVLPWVAGHESLVAGFRENRDVYSEFASRVYGRKIDRKKNPDDKQPGMVGKTAILGLGFQMGWYKFALALAAGPMGEAPIIFGRQDAENLRVDPGGFEQWLKAKDQFHRVEKMPSRLPLAERLVHCAVAKYLVDVYRTENRPITEFWKLMEQVLRAMVEGEEVSFGPGGVLRTVRHGIVMPSGLVMRYPGLRYSDDGNGDRGFSYMGGKSGRERVKAYGGSITENIVQSLARDVVAEQMLRARALGYRIATMTHDEVVARVPFGDGARAVEQIIGLMKTAPAWAPGLPLNAEGDHAVSYGEAK